MCNFSQVAIRLSRFNSTCFFVRRIGIKLANSSTPRDPFHEFSTNATGILRASPKKIRWKINEKLFLTLYEIIKFASHKVSSLYFIWYTKKKSNRPADSGERCIAPIHFARSRRIDWSVLCYHWGWRYHAWKYFLNFPRQFAELRNCQFSSVDHCRTSKSTIFDPAISFSIFLLSMSIVLRKHTI